ncbi:NDR1/HIN1-like protein 13 [Lycium ferocissimum]|uniref:NDR1/HIN1-like protein 13 n=1 Tax=Lycium ferocissimum TaxID=112874 RepID=UPI0028153DF2|nr:NDR1/HIN1-like protein 13 [Lycium ferocissimum]
MADRVHPQDSPPSSNNSSEAKPVPTPGTYVVQVPKDQIYRYPPPGNARHYESLTKRKPHRSCCCRCLCYTFSLLLILIIALGITVGVLYLIFRPESPKYSISDFTIKNFNLTSSSSPVSPQFNVTVRAENPNNKIGVYYRKGSSMTVVYSDVSLCNGELPAFYQPTNNVTVFKTALKGSNVILGNAVKTELRNEQMKGKVPFKVNIRVPVKVKVGAVKSWEIIVKVKCDIIVNALTAKSKIVSKDCKYSVRFW